MHRITIFHLTDCYEISYSYNRIIHIDKLIGDSQTRREILFEKLPDAVQNEILAKLEEQD